MRAVAVAILVVAALAFPGLASAKSYRITNADETFQVQGDGSVRVTERLTFAFSGAFHGAYRLIPSIGDQSISDVSIAEDGVSYSPGASAAVGSSGAPGTYGVELTPNGWTQVAWHFEATDASRTFTVSYTMHRYVAAYSDVDNLYIQVWGSQWPVAVDRLAATIELPGPVTTQEKNEFRAWGHPASVQGSVRLASSTVTFDATNIPATQFVEADVVFPSRLVNGDDVVRHAGAGLDAIVAREKTIFSSPYGHAPSPVGSTSGGGLFHRILDHILEIIFLPLFLVGRLFGFFRGSSDGSSGFGGSFGGVGGGGGGGGGGGAW